MKQIPETRDSLILQLKSAENRDAWEEFVELYRPVVYGVAVSRGLQHADALDLVQVVFLSVANSIARWEKSNEKTRFRHWLLRVAKNATINAMTRRPQDRGLGGDHWIPEHVGNGRWSSPSEPELDLEYRRQLYRRAAETIRTRVSEANWNAFQMTAVEGMSIEQAAHELGKTVGSIYALRSRIMKQLSSLVSDLEAAYE